MYKLIIVDDEPMIVEQLAMAFEWNKMGFELIETFTSGRQTMEYIQNNPVDCLLADVKMPNINGLDLAKYCYENHPYIGIVLISAYKNFEYAHQAIQYNIIDYVLKPISEEQFFSAMKKLYQRLDIQEQYLKRPSVTSKNMIIKEAVKFIAEHCCENITVEDVANHVLINPEYFGAYFKKHSGENFIECLRRHRLSVACDMLKNSDLKINVIAEQIGYKSATHFYEMFQNTFGLTPADYRKKFQS